MNNMEYKTNKDKRPGEIEFMELFGLRRDPVVFGDIEAIDYASRIDPDATLDSHRNICIRKAAKMIPHSLNGMTAIDIGCGEGRWSRFLAQRGAKVLGIDASPAMIDIATKRSVRNSNIIYRPIGLEDLAKFDQNFDIAIASYVFNNIADLNKIFHSGKEIINGDGEMVIITKTFGSENDNAEIKKFEGFFLPILVNEKFTMYVAANSCNDYNIAAEENDFRLVDHFSQLSPDRIENHNLREMQLQIEDHVFKYAKIREQ